MGYIRLWSTIFGPVTVLLIGRWRQLSTPLREEFGTGWKWIPGPMLNFAAAWNPTIQNSGVVDGKRVLI